MLDQLFELSRKAAESSLQSQQAMFKHWTQDWASTSPMTAGLSADWGGSMRKRWIELTLEALNKHRESLDSTYRAGIQTMEKLFRASDAKSSEDSAHAAEEVWRSLFETFKAQSEAHFRELQLWGERLLEMTQQAGS
jgi:hypothetical protein